MSARFQVATCEGYRINLPVAQRTSWSQEPGVSATVCDTLYQWREVKTYRSEDRLHVPSGRFASLGADGALAAARDHARYLNRLHRGD